MNIKDETQLNQQIAEYLFPKVTAVIEPCRQHPKGYIGFYLNENPKENLFTEDDDNENPDIYNGCEWFTRSMNACLGYLLTYLLEKDLSFTIGNMIHSKPTEYLFDLYDDINQRRYSAKNYVLPIAISLVFKEHINAISSKQ
jgi:hypothetical protein